MERIQDIRIVGGQFIYLFFKKIVFATKKAQKEKEHSVLNRNYLFQGFPIIGGPSFCIRRGEGCLPTSGGIPIILY